MFSGENTSNYPLDWIIVECRPSRHPCVGVWGFLGLQGNSSSVPSPQKRKPQVKNTSEFLTVTNLMVCNGSERLRNQNRSFIQATVHLLPLFLLLLIPSLSPLKVTLPLLPGPWAHKVGGGAGTAQRVYQGHANKGDMGIKVRVGGNAGNSLYSCEISKK